MRTSRFSRYCGLLLAAGTLGLGACKKDSDDSDVAASDGSITWTHNGTTHTSTSTRTASVIVDTGDKLLIMGTSNDGNNAVALGLQGINAKGPGVYELRKGTVLDDQPGAVVTLNGNVANQGTVFNSLYGPSPVNGTITVSQYDKNAQKISGTFTFTAGAVPNTSATGTQTVTNGSFSFTRFH